MNQYVTLRFISTKDVLNNLTALDKNNINTLLYTLHTY